jgi:hypothetical protein
MMGLAREKRPPEEPLGPQPNEGDDPRVDEDRVLVCAACSHGIARARDRIEVEGAHVHTFVNPSVVPYRIGCFVDAEGSVGVGEESTFWSWFKGYAWRVVVCTRCLAHVGWSFRNDDRVFFGLILDRLAER